MSEDSVRSLRNYFYIGNYQSAIEEANTLLGSSPRAEVYLNLALLEMAPSKVIQGVAQNASTSLQAIKLFAQYKTSSAEKKELILDTITEWLADAEMGRDPTLQLVAAQIFYEQGNLKQSLVLACEDSSENLAKLSLQVQIYLKLDRIDLAEKKVKEMQDLDDDDTLTRITTAWVHLAKGGNGITEANNIFQELLSNFGSTVKLLNGIAACQIRLKNYSGAFQSLKQARDISLASKEKVHADTLINSIVCLQHHKPGSKDIIEKITSEFQLQHPDHPWLKQMEEMGKSFDRYSENYH
jgi:coatomer protein complex subunit epsilon